MLRQRERRCGGPAGYSANAAVSGACAAAEAGACGRRLVPGGAAAGAGTACAPGAPLLERANSILAVEYCKALLRRGSRMRPIVLHRAGDYHGRSAADAPSASFLRGQADWTDYMPEAARAVQAAAPRYRLAAGERAVLARLRAMGEDEFAALPYGSEGLWQKVMHACRTEASLEGILAAAKSKRYPRTRLMRMLLCAFLGLTEQQLTEPAPYVCVLAFDADGRAILRAAQGGLPLLHAGERAQDCAFAETERRCRALYGLFRENGPRSLHRNRASMCKGIDIVQHFPYNNFQMRTAHGKGERKWQLCFGSNARPAAKL